MKQEKRTVKVEKSLMNEELTAHEFDSEEAQKAGEKGSSASHVS